MSVDQDSRVGVSASLSVVLGQLSDTLQGVRDTADKLHKFLSENKVQSPISRTWTAAGRSDASAATWTFIDCGMPNAGRVWDVRLVSVTGTDPADTSLAGNPVLCTGRNVPGNGSAFPVGLVILNPGASGASATGIPASSTFGAGEAAVLNGDHLIVAIKSAGNSVNFVVSVVADDYREDDKFDWLTR